MMMKLLLLFVSMFAYGANAFAPSITTFGTRRVSRTQTYVIDPHMIQHLVEHGQDAVSATFINCDSQGCELMHADHDLDGNWNFRSDGPAAEPPSHHSEMLMLDIDDE